MTIYNEKQSLEAVVRSRYDLKADHLYQKHAGAQISVLESGCVHLEVQKMSIEQSTHVPSKNIIDIHIWFSLSYLDLLIMVKFTAKTALNRG